MTEIYKTSRATVRHALSILENKELIQRRHG
ncbi:GntR family transcriptional regulator [Lactovum odontotermitis]